MATTVDNNMVAAMAHKVMVVLMEVVMAMAAVVVVVMTVAVDLVVAEIIRDVVGLATTFTPNIGMACPGRSVLPS